MRTIIVSMSALLALCAAAEAEVLFEDRTVPVESGRLTDSFGWLGVHVYRLAQEAP